MKPEIIRQVEKEKVEEVRMPITAHLEELRKRIIISLLSLGVGFLISYYFVEKIVSFLIWPVIHAMPSISNLVFTGVTEGFLVYIKVAFISGIVLSSPIIIYETWAFIAPGLYRNEKKMLIFITVTLTLSFIIGFIFSYIIFLPVLLKFLLSFSTPYLLPMLSLREYISFCLWIYLVTGLCFEFPLLVYFLSRAGIVTYRGLKNFRKYAAVLIFIIAAILTPPDIISQILFAIPLLLLFEIGVLISRFTTH